MTITESRIRQIIRQEARQVLREEGAMQQAGASLDSTVSAAGTAANAAIARQKAMTTGMLTPAQINESAEAITNALLAGVDVFKIMGSIPGARDLLKAALAASITAGSKTQEFVGRALSNPAVLAATVQDMIANKQITGIVTRLQAQNKGYAEIAGAIVDAILARMVQTVPT